MSRAKTITIKLREFEEIILAQIDTLGRLRHRAKVRGGPDTSAMHIAKDAIATLRLTLQLARGGAE